VTTKRLGKNLRLSSAERDLFVRVLVVTWVTWLGLWLLPFRILCQITSRTELNLPQSGARHAQARLAPLFDGEASREW